MFDLSNTPIIYFACDEDEEIPREANEEEEEEEEGGK